jgi:hypothetical protein
MVRRNGFLSVAILGIMAILIVGMIGGIIFMSLRSPSPQAAVTKTSNAMPTEETYLQHTLDLSAGVADAQKTIIIIQQSDSSREKVILPTTSVDAYIQGLPEGTKVISQSPFTN